MELSDEGFGGSRFGGFRGGPSRGSYFDRRPTGRSGPRGRGGPTGPRRRAGPTGPRGRGGYQPEDEPAEGGEAGEVDPKASWYSQWSQYSAPAVRYIPEVRKPTFTNCDLQAVGEGTEMGTI